MTLKIDTVSIEEAKRIAEFQLAATNTTRNALLEEHSASFRWLMASLLAVNGSALIASKELFSSPSFLAIIALFSFYLGLCAALAVAWLAQRSVQSMIEPLGEIISLWTMTAATGDLKVDLYQAAIDQLGAAQKVTRKPRIAGFLSIAAFSNGLIFSVLANG